MATKKQTLEKLTSLEGSVRRGEKDAALLKAKQAKELVATLREPATATPPPPPPPPASKLIIGLDAGNYGIEGARDVKGCVSRVRSENSPTRIRQFREAGLTILAQYPGPYNSGGVKAIDPDWWVLDALSFYKTNLNPMLAPVVEVLNEVAGSWFWGSGCDSQANADAYAILVRKTHDAFHAEYGNAAPKIIASVHGYGGDSLDWGRKWLTPAIAPYVDGIVVHPYGGRDSRSASALGNRDLVLRAHKTFGKPVHITEVGWPSGHGAPDSLEWSEAEQAANISGFVNWAKQQGTDVIAEVIIFCHHDWGDQHYAVVRLDGSHKPSYDVLKSLAA